MKDLVVIRRIVSLSHYDFWTSRFGSCDPTSLWITSLQVNDLWGYLINLSRSKYNILKNISSFLNILRFKILQKVHVQNFRYLDVCTRYFLCSYDAFKQHCDSWLKPKSCSSEVWKLELNFHIKANTGHRFCSQQSNSKITRLNSGKNWDFTISWGFSNLPEI